MAGRGRTPGSLPPMTHIPRPTAPRLPALADPGADVADLLATLVVGDGTLPNILGVMGHHHH